MKKQLLYLLLLLLFLACAPMSKAVDSVPTEVSVSVLSSVSPKTTERATALPIQTETPPDSPTPTPFEYASFPCNVPGEPLLREITVKDLEWEKLTTQKQYHTKFWNETVDFQNFRFSVESLCAEKTGTVFTLRIEVPKEWTDLQTLSLNQYIGFRFYLDDKAVHDFFLSDQSVILSDALSKTRCDGFTMTYTSETVTEEVMHAGHEWTITPFFIHWKNFAGNKYNNNEGRTWIDVTNGDFCEYNGTETAYLGGEIEVTELKEFKLTLPIEHTHELPEPTHEPKLLQVSLWTEDVERNEQAGHYGSDGRLKAGSFVVYGTWQNVTVDFSELEIHVERLYYWNHGFFCLQHIVYPESWPEEVRRNVRLVVLPYVDGELFGETIDNKGHSRSYFKAAGSNWRNRGNPKNNAPYPTEAYTFFDQHRFSLVNPIKQKELTFRVTLEYCPKLQDPNGRTIDLTDGKPYYVDSDDVVLITETIPLGEFSISTDKLTFSQGGAK